jgi:hypothetical protein
MLFLFHFSETKQMHMKKFYFLSVLSLMINMLSFGQISKGSVLLGGDFSTFIQEQKTSSGNANKNNGFSFSPLIGVATRQNIIQGGYLRIGSTKSTNNFSSAVTKTTNTGVGYFIRKYGIIKNNFSGFIQGNAGVGYSTNSFELQNSVNKSRQTSIGINVSPGLSYKISQKLHLESGLNNIANISYQVTKNLFANPGINDVLRSTQVSISSSLNNFSTNLYFGFRLLLDKK